LAEDFAAANQILQIYKFGTAAFFSGRFSAAAKIWQIRIFGGS